MMVLRDLLGHLSVVTTEAYLRRLEYHPHLRGTCMNARAVRPG